MSRYHALAISTRYWKPGTRYLDEIAQVLAGKVADGDFVVVSEKALSTAMGNVVDESHVTPSLSAKFIAKVWVPLKWGSALGVACRFGPRLLFRLKKYPFENGSRHKQVCLQYSGLPQSLMFGSEGGIDGSNLPYSLVSLPLSNAHEVAMQIRSVIRSRLDKEVAVLIVDTDKTYSFRNFHFTPRPKSMRGISSRGGIVVYIVGRMLKLRKRPTPLAVAGSRICAETALILSNVADRARGPGSGATVWDMAARFKVATTAVTWCMLEKVRHKPIVLIRVAKNSKS